MKDCNSRISIENTFEMDPGLPSKLCSISKETYKELSRFIKPLFPVERKGISPSHLINSLNYLLNLISLQKQTETTETIELKIKEAEKQLDLIKRVRRRVFYLNKLIYLVLIYLISKLNIINNKSLNNHKVGWGILSLKSISFNYILISQFIKFNNNFWR